MPAWTLVNNFLWLILTACNVPSNKLSAKYNWQLLTKKFADLLKYKSFTVNWALKWQRRSTEGFEKVPNIPLISKHFNIVPLLYHTFQRRTLSHKKLSTDWTYTKKIWNLLNSSREVIDDILPFRKGDNYIVCIHTALQSFLSKKIS